MGLTEQQKARIVDPQLVRRIKGHRGSYEIKNGVSIAPHCSCGWHGPAGNKSQAKALYEQHKRAVERTSAEAFRIAQGQQ